MNPEIDGYFTKAKTWRQEFGKLRAVILDHPLLEELKWGKPCYTFQGSNILIIQGFKAYCALMFCKGALLEDAEGILVQQTPSVQAARQVRFTGAGEIVEMETVLHVYIKEAIAAERAGRKVEFRKNPEPVPEELQSRFTEDRALRAAFAALTPGRQRGYILHFSGAKQSKTREARIEKWTPHILNGKGLDDE